MKNGRQAQTGQALAEGMLVLLVAGLLWVAIVQVNQLQDMANQAQNASRVAVFRAANDTIHTDISAVKQAHFSGVAHRWRDHAGKRMLPDPDAHVSLQLTQYAGLPALAQPGQADRYAMQLRREWGVEDQGFVRAATTVQVAVPFTPHTQMRMRRHTALLRDAAHSADAHSAQRRVGTSATAWADAARQSQSAGERTQSVLTPIDAAWHRPAPSYDWLMPWAGQSPTQVLHD